MPIILGEVSFDFAKKSTARHMISFDNVVKFLNDSKKLTVKIKSRLWKYKANWK